MVSSKSSRAKRVRLVCVALSASALGAMALTVKFATPTEAKTPGSTYCYYGVCHRVKTIDETKALVRSQRGQIPLAASNEIVHRNDVRTVIEQPFAQM